VLNLKKLWTNLKVRRTRKAGIPRQPGARISSLYSIDHVFILPLFNLRFLNN
jgi:hypothetical protein